MSGCNALLTRGTDSKWSGGALALSPPTPAPTFSRFRPQLQGPLLWEAFPVASANLKVGLGFAPWRHGFGSPRKMCYMVPDGFWGWMERVPEYGMLCYGKELRRHNQWEVDIRLSGCSSPLAFLSPLSRLLLRFLKTKQGHLNPHCSCIKVRPDWLPLPLRPGLLHPSIQALHAPPRPNQKTLKPPRTTPCPLTKDALVLLC